MSDYAGIRIGHPGTPAAIKEADHPRLNASPIFFTKLFFRYLVQSLAELNIRSGTGQSDHKSSSIQHNMESKAFDLSKDIPDLQSKVFLVTGGEFGTFEICCDRS